MAVNYHSYVQHFDADNKCMHLVHCNLMAMAICRYTTEHIYQCVVLRASIEATGHRNWSSIHSILPRQLPWSWWLPWYLYRIFFNFKKQTNLIQQSGDHWKGLFKATYNLLFNWGKCVEFKEIWAIYVINRANRPPKKWLMILSVS